MAELNELFEEIFYSERKYEAKNDYLKTLNNSVKEATALLDKTKEELQNKQGELAVKNTKLINVETEITLLQFRKSIFQIQKQQITEEKANLLDSHATILKEVASEKESFNKVLDDFCRYYDLSGSGLRYREEQEKKELSSLQEELVLIETELLEIESYTEDKDKLAKELKKAEESLQKDIDVGEVLKAQEMEQLLLIGELEKKEHSIDRKQVPNLELKNLQGELDACKTCEEEDTCKRLRQELEDLQEEYYRKQMKLQVGRQSRLYKTSSHQAIKQNLKALKERTSIPVGGIMEQDACMLESDYESDSSDSIWNTVEQMDLSVVEGNLSDEVEEIKSNLIGLPKEQHSKTRNTTAQDPPHLDQNQMHTSSFARGCISSKADFKERIVNDIHTTSSRSKGSAGATGRRGRSSNTVLKDRGSCSSTSIKRSNPASSSFTTQTKCPCLSTDSPNPHSVSRKRPGESIYKAPGTHSETTSMSNQPKKKVHFHY